MFFIRSLRLDTFAIGLNKCQFEIAADNFSKIVQHTLGENVLGYLAYKFAKLLSIEGFNDL